MLRRLDIQTTLRRSHERQPAAVAYEGCFFYTVAVVVALVVFAGVMP